MGLVVQKFGGTSVADPSGSSAVARRVVAARGRRRTTSSSSSRRWATRPTSCVELAHQVSPTRTRASSTCCSPPASGSRCALLAMAIHDLGRAAISFTGRAGGHRHRHRPTGRRGSSTSGRAAIHDALDAGQDRASSPASRASRPTCDVTTLGRGGSDTTAVALAAALGRRRLRDLHRRRGRLHRRPARRPATRASSPPSRYEEMLELAAGGAQGADAALGRVRA